MRDKLLDITSNEHLLQNKISIKSSLKNSLELKKRQHMINSEKHNPVIKPFSDQNIKIFENRQAHDGLTEEKKELDKDFPKPILTNSNEENKRPTSSAKSKKIQFNETISLNKQHLLRATSTTNAVRLNGKNITNKVNKFQFYVFLV